MTAVERERPTTKTPTGWDRRGPSIVAIVAIVVPILTLLFAMGFLPSVRDFVRVDVQKNKDDAQDAVSAGLKTDVATIKGDVKTLLERIPEKKGKGR